MSDAAVKSVLRASSSAQELSRPLRGRGSFAAGRIRRDRRPARPQWRRQDHLVLHDRGPGQRRRRHHHARRRTTSPACRCTSARAWAWATCRRKPRCSAACRSRTTSSRSSRRAPTSTATGAAQRLEQILEELRIGHVREQRRHGAVGRRATPRGNRAGPGGLAALHPAGRALRGRRPDLGARHPEDRHASWPRAGIGVLITDHNVRETLGVCNRACIVDRGTVIASGSAEEILANERVREVYLGQNFRM